tara:strand:- start:620 stop:817 length:198 start_codon:yes stop_codon:yes gene_type:complete
MPRRMTRNETNSMILLERFRGVRKLSKSFRIWLRAMGISLHGFSSGGDLMWGWITAWSFLPVPKA